MDLCLKPSYLRGETHAVPSKSDVHRLMILGAIGEKDILLRMPPVSSMDLRATRGALEELGAVFEETEDGLRIHPIRREEAARRHPVIQCGESGSTLRFLIPLVMTLTEEAEFHGEGRLPDRPLGDILEILEAAGCVVEGDKLPIRIKGKISLSSAEVNGGVSSQFLTGLLLASALRDEESVLRVKGDFQSKSYVRLTVKRMRDMGYTVRVSEDEMTYTVCPSERKPAPSALFPEGDESNAAFFLAMGALQGPVLVEGLMEDAVQGDRAIHSILKDFGALYRREGRNVYIQSGEKKPLRIDMREIPDLFPVLASLLLFAEGESVLYGGERLRYKESDRISAMVSLLKSVGGDVTETEDGVIIRGGKSLHNAEVSSFKDHRIAMAAALIAANSEGEVLLHGADAVTKSDPDFFESYEKIGGKIVRSSL